MNAPVQPIGLDVFQAESEAFLKAVWLMLSDRSIPSAQRAEAVRLVIEGVRQMAGIADA